jgi:outer membrane protein
MQMKIHRIPRLTLVAIAVFSTLLAAAQEPLTLSQAVSIALEKNPVRKMALADVQIATAHTSMAKSGFMPHIGFSETATLGNDPVYAFGTKLRQGRFTAADFALDQLNYPSSISNFSSRFGGQWNIFNTFASTYQLRRAKSMQQASQQQLTRADQELVFRVIDSYYAVLLAKKQVDVAEQTIKTAQSMVDTSTSRVEAGTAVEADALSAKVNLASRREELIRAKSAWEMARTQLETALGARLSSGQQPADLLKEQTFPSLSLDESEALAIKQRADLQAISSQLTAQQNSVKAAKAAFGPHLDVFGSWQADNPALFTGGNNNWMTGAELRIDLFAHEKRAQLSVEKATLSRTEAARQSAEDNVRLDVRRAYFEHDAARQMLEVARATVAQAEESLRITRDRYESGLVTITDLLRTEDADRASRSNYWNSVYRYVTSYAALQLASGDLSAQSPVVNQ